MGLEAQCTARIGKGISDGRALLEAHELIVRMTAAESAGLVDIKIVGFSQTHTAK